MKIIGVFLKKKIIGINRLNKCALINIKPYKRRKDKEEEKKTFMKTDWVAQLSAAGKSRRLFIYFFL